MRVGELSQDRQTTPSRTRPARSGNSTIPRRISSPVGSAEPAEATKAGGRLPALPVTLFVIALCLPWNIQVGALALGPYRFVLLALILPCLQKWATGGAGRMRFADFAFLFYCLWSSISLTVIHGSGPGLQSGGILFIETMGAYLLGRCYIRTVEDYYNVVLLLFRIVLFLLPFAVIEAFTGNNLLLTLTRMIFTTHPDQYDTRWGLRRVQSIMEHPILFGVVISSVLGPVYFVLGYGQTFAKRYWKAAVVAVTAFLSMSSGPISGLFAQIVLISWDGILSGFAARWKLLWLGLLAVYIAVSLGSNQSFFEFFMTHFSFSPENAYYRVLIWHFGSGSVMNHPLFGTSMSGWDRPDWMPPSIDMFWLYHGILYGIPSAFAMLAAFLSIFATVSFKKISNPRLQACRLGFLASMTSFFLVGWTVHFWNVTYVLFLFSLGSGVWLLDTQSQPETGKKEPTIPPSAGRESALTRKRASPSPRAARTREGSDNGNV